MELVKISKVKPNQNNPRFIKDSKFLKLVRSVKEFPEMLKLRPIVVNKDMVVLGGNMRLKACKEAGLKEVYILIADELTEQQEQEFIVKDNVGFGEWDWDTLANEWEVKELEEWGLDGFPFDADEQTDEKYTRKIEAPTYKPNNKKPNINELTNESKYKELVNEINNSKLDQAEKNFLIKSAQRHLVFDYSKIADYYANSNSEVQDLMEKSALIIIDLIKLLKMDM